jgi:DNA-binding MurR/RpiR family transcriptional regulator
MPEKRPKSIESRIHEFYETFSDTERKIADVILDFPSDLSTYTATELASLAGVSKASGSRFFQRLGFSSFEEARKLARERRQWGSPLYIEKKSLSQHINSKDYLESEIELLKNSFRNLDPKIMDEVIHSIVGAKRIWIVGFRNSHFLGGYLRWQLLQFRGDVYGLNAPGETFGEYTGDFVKSDLLIGIGLRRRPKELGKILESAAKSGAKRLLITDPTARRLPALVDWTLVVDTQSPFLLDSAGPALSLLRLLAISAFNLSGKLGRAHMERVEHQHEILGDLD